jgi:hypothetical protein
MDYSTAVTEELVQEVLEDTVSVVTDWHFASWRKKDSIDTGNWTLLHRSKNQVDRPPGNFGLNLVCNGKAMRRGGGKQGNQNPTKSKAKCKK